MNAVFFENCLRGLIKFVKINPKERNSLGFFS